jgi:hypothetical protein
MKKLLSEHVHLGEDVLVETFSRETLDPHYVTGFTDGEGAFTYSRSGNQLALYYALKLTATDLPILEEIQMFFGGIGRIYDVKARAPGPRSGATKSAKYYRVSHRDELAVIVDHFDRYPLRTTKRSVYEVWRLMVLLKRKFRQPDRNMLDQLAAQLSSLSPRNQPWR